MLAWNTPFYLEIVNDPVQQHNHDVNVIIAGLPNLSKKMSRAIGQLHNAGSSGSSLDIDLATYDKKAEQFFYNKSIGVTMGLLQDDNGNTGSGMAELKLTDPLDFWIANQVSF